jgi:zinc transporter, ZIP family
LNWEVLAISTISGLATGIGALILMFFGTIRRKALSALLGFAAGMMISISTMGLLPEALEFGSVGTAGAGFALGLLLMLVLDNRIPHLHMFQKRGSAESMLKWVCSLPWALPCTICRKV